MNSVIEYIKENSLGSYSVDVDMSRHTTYKIGGTCGLFVEPNSIESVSLLIQFLSKKQVKYFIIGNGSNIILPDGYYNIVVIKLTKICNYKVEDSYVYVEAGILAPKLALELAYKGISGFEFISGVPGTIGGCVYMNAGAYGKETKDVLISVIAYDCNSNKLVELDNAELEFRYRHSIFQKGNFIILAAKFKYELQNSEEIVK